MDREVSGTRQNADSVSGGPEAGDTATADLRLSGGAAGVCTGRDPLHICASSPLPSVS